MGGYGGGLCETLAFSTYGGATEVAIHCFRAGPQSLKPGSGLFDRIELAFAFALLSEFNAI